MSKLTCTLFVVAAILLLSGSVLAPLAVFAQNKMVVVPLFGDDPKPTPSVPAPVHKTGQTTSSGDRDDGAFQKGVAWPSPRFTDNDNGTVTDNLTGFAVSL